MAETDDAIAVELAAACDAARADVAPEATLPIVSVGILLSKTMEACTTALLKAGVDVAPEEPEEPPVEEVSKKK